MTTLTLPAVGAPTTAPRARPAAAARRERRAVVAQRLLDLAPAAADAVDWDALDAAPDWLALPDASFLILQARLGALLHAPAIRLWIDGPRLAAARVLLGEAVLDDLIAQPHLAALASDPSPRMGELAAGDAPAVSGGRAPSGWLPCAPIESASRVGSSLRATGWSVLLAALPPGPLREALTRGLAPVAPAQLTPELATSLIVRARRLGAEKGGAS